MSFFRPSDSALRCFTTRPQRLQGERGLLRSSYDTRPAYCQDQQCRQSNVCRYKLEMVSFEFGKEIKRDFFVLSRAWDIFPCTRFDQECLILFCLREWAVDVHGKFHGPVLAKSVLNFFFTREWVLYMEISMYPFNLFNND